MYVRNKAARLITLTWNGEKYKFMPAGGSVEVPDSAKKSDFLKALVKDQSLEIRDSEAQDDLLDDIDELAPLREEASSLGIKVDKRWGETKLQEVIDAKLAEGDQE